MSVIDDIKEKWTQEAYEQYELHTGNQIIDIPHNNEVDAYRHAYVSAKLTQYLMDVQFLAEIVLDDHEVNSDNEPLGKV